MDLARKMLDLCDGRPTKERTARLIKWLQEKRLLKRRIKCRLCKRKMQMKPRLELRDGAQWECRYKTHRGKTVKKSVRSRSMFERSKISLQRWIKFIYRSAVKRKRRSTGQRLGG